METSPISPLLITDESFRTGTPESE